jgi:hypothetical protein
MTDVHILAIDLAKRSFQICATAPGGRVCGCPRFCKAIFRRSGGSALISLVCQSPPRKLLSNTSML